MKKSYLFFILILSAFLAFSCSNNDDDELVNTGREGQHQDDNGTDTLPEAVTDDEDKTDTTSASDEDKTDTVSEYDDSDDNSDDIDISDIDISENNDDHTDSENNSDDTVISDNDTSENDDDDSTDPDTDTDSGDSQPDEDGDTSSPEPAFPQCSPTSSKPCILGKLIWSETKKTKRTQGGCNTDCNNLNEAGYSSGWRLPTINELRTLVQNCSKTVSLPDGVCQVSDDCIQTSCKVENDCKCSSGNDYSKLGDTDSLWSGTKVESNMSAAWYINFSSAYIDSTNTSEKKSARCVHEIK